MPRTDRGRRTAGGRATYGPGGTGPTHAALDRVDGPAEADVLPQL